MWFATIFRRKSSTPPPLFDEAFLRRLERLSLQAQRTLRGTPIVGRYPGRQPMPATIFSDHRPYVPGDDLRYLDWNVYARQEQLLVRLGETEQDVAVSVILDTSRSMAMGEPDRLRLAIQLSGAIGYLALAHGDRVSVLAGDRSSLIFGPARGKMQAVELFTALREVTPTLRTDLVQAAQQIAQRSARGGLVLFLSDLLTAMPMERLAQILPAPRWQVMVLHLLSRTETAPNLQGPLELVDSETGERMAVDLDAETLAAYRTAVQNWRSAIARHCLAYGISYASIMTDWVIERQIIPFLRVRRFLT
jgi:uncharacterized protein (DUF58 family)